MSFASEVKKEATLLDISARHCKIAMLTGLFLCGSVSINSKGLTFITENEHVEKRAFTLIKELLTDCKIDSEKSNISYKLILRDNKDRNSILQLLKLNKNLGEAIDLSEIDLTKSCCKRAFITGCFMGGGSLSNPDKSYHFEIVCRTKKLACMIDGILKDFDIKSKIISRKDVFVVYVKESESIASVLLVLGTSNALMELENIRIKKQFINQINRKVNFETSNICRVASAADKYIIAIEKLVEKVGMSGIDAGLQEVALLRMNNPDKSLQELSDISNGLSKSCINHRLRRLKKMADDII